MDFAIIKKAGLGQQEFAELVGVSRISVNNWVREKNEPSVHIQPDVKRYLTLLTAANRLKYLPGDLPTMHKNNVDSRREYIRAKLDDTAARLRARKKQAKGAKKANKK